MPPPERDTPMPSGSTPQLGGSHAGCGGRPGATRANSARVRPTVFWAAGESGSRC